jgi:hypothetical protein
MDLAQLSDVTEVNSAAVLLSFLLVPRFTVEFPELFETVKVAIHSPGFCVSASRRDRSWSALDAP